MRNAILTAALAGVLAVTGAAGVATASEPDTKVYTGVIDGAEYRVELPARWNGRLLLFSHGFYPPGYVPDVAVVNQAAARPELLDQGYALAASNYRTPDGYAVKNALADQIALLDWFESEVGKPRQVLAWGASMGGLISTLLAERNPDRIDGVLPMCAPLAGTVGHMNQGLDTGFVVRTLLGADADLVDITDPDGNEAAAVTAVRDALATPSGRARFALAATVAGIPAWSRALEPRPTELDARIDQQADHVVKFLALLIWGAGRASVEERAGGNPSGNVGVDYAELLSRAGERDLVVDAYRKAGLDLDADLARLDAAPRIAPDPAAVRWLTRYGQPSGRTPAPVLTVHPVGDGVGPEHERRYAELVDLAGDPGKLRQLYVKRGVHCMQTAAEEVTAVGVLATRVRTGRWPATDPGTLNATAAAYPDEMHVIYDWMAERSGRSEPAYTRYQPAPFPRPFA